jgi:hypothetical protein
VTPGAADAGAVRVRPVADHRDPHVGAPISFVDLNGR